MNCVALSGGAPLYDAQKIRTPPCSGNLPTKSSSGANLVAKPLTSARSATRVASSSAVPRFDPYSTSSGVLCPGRGRARAAADAGALAVAEWLPGIDRTRGFGFGAEVLRVEGFGVRSPDRRIAVQRHQVHQNERALLEFVFSADDLVLEWCQAIGRRG